MYKKIVYVLFIISSAAFAQNDKTQEKLEISKGTFVLGGAGQVRSEKVKSKGFGIESETENSTVLWGIDGGYAVVKNVIVGGNFNYSNSKTSQFNSDFLGFGLFAKGFKPLGMKTALTLRFDSSYSFGKRRDLNFRTNSTDEDITKVDALDLRLSPGFTYFISPKVALEFTTGVLNYRVSTSKNLDTEFKTRINSFDFIYNLSNVTLGVNIYL